MGGGAYYSFVRRSHEYTSVDIELDEQGLFRVGFAGADYGFFVSLGRGEIQGIQQSQEPPPTWLSARKPWDDAWNYRPPTDTQEVRKEQQGS